MAETLAQGEDSSIGMDPKLAGLLAYLFGVISGLIFYLIEKKSRYIRFHAMQAMLMSGALFVASFVFVFIPVVNVIALPLLQLLGIVLWIMMMIKAWQGQYFKLPVVGDIAEKNAAPPAA